MTIDKDNNIYLGDLAANAIGVISADKKYRRLAQSPNLSWVDSFSFGPTGQLVAVVNRLHQSATLNGGVSNIKTAVLSVTGKIPGGRLAGTINLNQF